ncbi:RNA polymerase sigma factor [Pseudobdellovibrio exovorus]|nr:sigma-70 family RNA polymerase sigma factor [Pseudobdellovibrio exovorus]
MKLYQNGDEAAFQQLYSRHSSKIYGFIKKRIPNEAKVSEIYQEVFIKIHKSKHRYNDSFAVLPWIFTVTKSVLIDEVRKDKKIEGQHVMFEDVIASGPEVTASPIDTDSLLGQLPSQQQKALELRYVDDKTFNEIAATLNMSENNARQIISRGIRRLRQLVNPSEKVGGNHDRS